MEITLKTRKCTLWNKFIFKEKTYIVQNFWNDPRSYSESGQDSTDISSNWSTLVKSLWHEVYFLAHRHKYSVFLSVSRFTSTANLHLLNARDQLAHPYKTSCHTTGLPVLVYTCLRLDKNCWVSVSFITMNCKSCGGKCSRRNSMQIVSIAEFEIGFLSISSQKIRSSVFESASIIIYYYYYYYYYHHHHHNHLVSPTSIIHRQKYLLWINQIKSNQTCYFNLTFGGPCIVIYSYNES
jgi:hypothetical protein